MLFIIPLIAFFFQSQSGLSQACDLAVDQLNFTVNFPLDANGDPICPYNTTEFVFGVANGGNTANECCGVPTNNNCVELIFDIGDPALCATIAVIAGSGSDVLFAYDPTTGACTNAQMSGGNGDLLVVSGGTAPGTNNVHMVFCKPGAANNVSIDLTVEACCSLEGMIVDESQECQADLSALPVFANDGTDAAVFPGTITYTPLVATAACDESEITISVMESALPDDCVGGAITRTFALEAPCVAPVNVVQTLTDLPNSAPVITCPADESIECIEDFVAGTASATFSCLSGPGIFTNTAPSLLTGAANCPGATYGVTYTVEDACGNTASCTQTITLTSGLPTITCPADQIVECASDIVVDAADAMVTTFCSLGANVVVTFAIVGDPDCPGTTHTYTYTVSDDCGNSASCQQVFTIDNLAPTITCPADEIVECVSDIMIGTPVTTASCGQGSLTTTGPTLASGVGNCSGAIYEIEYTFSDECGRSASCIQSFEISNAPVAITDCPPGTTVPCPSSFTANVNDISFTTSCDIAATVAITGPVFSGPTDCPGTTMTYTYTVTDDCGNIASCDRVFILDPPSLELDQTLTVCSGANIDLSLMLEAGSSAAASFNIQNVATTETLMPVTNSSDFLNNSYPINISGTGLSTEAYLNMNTNVSAFVTYTITPVSPDGCEGKPVDVIIEILSGVVLSLESEGVCIGEVGTVFANPDGGLPPISVTWSDLGTGTATGYLLSSINNEPLLILTDQNVTTSGSIDLMVEAMDSFGCIQFGFITVELQPFPTIEVQPQDQGTCPDGSVTFSVSVLEPNVTYQWHEFIALSGATRLLDGATSPELTLTGVTENMNGNKYSVAITIDNDPDPDCTRLSDPACLYVHTPEPMICNDQVYISLDENCTFGALDAGAFLESMDATASFYQINVFTDFGEPLNLTSQNDPLFIGNFAGQCLTYEIEDICYGYTCWGTVCLEDKVDPVVDCECQTPFLEDGVTPNPDCTFNCYEVWDLEILEDLQRGNNEILPDADNLVPDDNCINFGDPITALSYSDGPGCEDLIVTRELLWTYTDQTGTVQYLNCTQNFLFQGLDINSIGSTVNGTWDGYPDIFTANSGDRPMSDFYTPEPIVNLPCGAGTDPADIAAIYDIDTPGRPAGIDRDDHSQTPNIVEHNEGYAYAYPYVVQSGWAGRFHAKPIDNNIVIYTQCIQILVMMPVLKIVLETAK